jgi:pseudaminic acid cytidylyltransferase
MRVAIIPARGGSKRIPGKNIKPFLGKPMIGWAIEAGLKSEVFDHVIVSTDDEEIAEVANSYGASTPFRRPAALSDDFTDTRDVMCHAIDWCRSNLGEPKSVCCIYATSPMIQVDDLRAASALSDLNVNSYVLPVTTYQFPIHRSLVLNDSVEIQPLYPEYISARSQDLPECYHDAGQFYFAAAHTWCQKGSVLDRKNTPIIIPRHRVQDIDTLEDWVVAEKLFNVLRLDGLK